jgi:hypothetical protein
MLVFGGYTNGSGNPTNAIQYLTIASTGNSVDFGDLSSTRFKTRSAASSTRAITASGLFANSSYLNTIQYVTIASTGNAIDFGDMTYTTSGDLASCSNAHGGL